MEYRRLGTTGLKVSVLSYGAWVSFKNQVDLSLVKDLLQACKDGGMNFFDNAEVYANGDAEQLMGDAIKELGWKRSDYVISTKIFWGGSGPNDKGLSRKHIIEGTQASLKRMSLDYVDLLYCHRPDPETPIEETVRAMNYCVDKGWALYWGTSEWSAVQISEAWRIADKLNLQGPSMEQPQYNLFHREKVEVEYAALYAERGLGTTIWSPLAGGLLTGKYSGGTAPEGSRLTLDNHKSALKTREHQIEVVDQLRPIALELGGTLAQLALAWAAKNPHVSTVITGATKIEQVHDNLGALALLPKLTPDVLERIEAIVKSKPVSNL